MIWDRRKHAWHDKLFRTYVVRAIYPSRMKRVASAVIIAIGVGLFALDLLAISVTGDSSYIGGPVGLFNDRWTQRVLAVKEGCPGATFALRIIGQRGF